VIPEDAGSTVERVETIVAKRGPFRALLRRILRARPNVILTRRGDGLLYVSDGRRELSIVSQKRFPRYELGIAAHVAKLLKAYGVKTLVPVSANDLVVNVGANIGELTIGLCELGCQVIAIEPDPKTLQCLRLNVPPSVEIFPTGLWKEDGDVTFYQKPQSADTSAINQCGPPITIFARRLDSLLADRPGRIRLLAGDAEGAEPEVLLGAADILNRVDYVSLQCGPERYGECTADACAGILREHGFQIISGIDSKYLIARNGSITR